MIVREVLEHPELIERFDFFNDTRDTVGFLRMVNTPKSLALAARLEELDAAHWEARHQQWLVDQAKQAVEAPKVAGRLLRKWFGQSG